MQEQSANFQDHIVDFVEDLFSDVVQSEIRTGDLNSISHDIEGYATCRNPGCGTLVIKQVAKRAFGFCELCAKDLLGSSVRVAEVINAGRRAYVPLKSRKTERCKYPDQEKKANKARQRAMKRLKLMFPEIYDILLAEERAKEGLVAWTVEHAVDQSAKDPSQATLDFATVYAALSQQGVDLHGLEEDEARQDLTR